jgi:FtsH-binding integral membrane protein
VNFDEQIENPVNAKRGSRMTINQALRGWYRFLGVGLMAVGVVAAGWQATWYNHIFRAAVLSFLLVSVFGVFAFGFRCPRCRASLVHKATTILVRGRAFACPKCGVGLYEPRESPANPK